MKLTYDQIRSITFGAAYTKESEQGVSLFRFSEKEMEFYKTVDKDFFMKAHSSSGIRLEFTTNSRRLSFEAITAPGSSRPFCHFDLYRDGLFLGQVGTRSVGSTVVAEYDLGEGEKEIKIYLPWSASATLSSLILDDGATLTPATKARSMLIYGDSITQGYDTLHPSLSYANLLADALDADAQNKAIGGEFFRPELAEAGEADPDIITVAYGTNDWSKKTREEFEKNSESFYRTLSEKYPRAKIFAITPIWRADCHRITGVGEFPHVAQHIERVCAPFPNVTVLHGFDCVPKEEGLFADGYLHPNEKGFIPYFTNIYAKMKQYL